MADVIRVGILGAGIGREHLRAYLQLSKQFQVVELCDLDLARAEAAVFDEAAGSTLASSERGMTSNTSTTSTTSTTSGNSNGGSDVDAAMKAKALAMTKGTDSGSAALSGK